MIILLFLKKTVRGLYLFIYFLSFLTGKGFMKVLVYSLVWNLSLDRLWNLCSYYYSQVEKTNLFFLTLVEISCKDPTFGEVRERKQEYLYDMRLLRLKQKQQQNTFLQKKESWKLITGK